MHIDTTVPAANHVKSVINEIIKSNDLPFREILPAAAIARHLADIEYRDRVFTPDLTIFGFLAQAMGEDQSCQQAVTQVIAHLARCGEEMPSTNTAAYCNARSRLPEEVLSGLAKETAEELETGVKETLLWRNRHIKMPDGTTVSMPDTLSNQAAYPQPHTQQAGIGFPIARMVGVFSLSTGALLDLAIAPWSGKGTGEHSLFRQLLHVFREGDIMIADKYYASFFVVATLKRMGVDVVIPQHAARDWDFRRGTRISQGDHLVEWKKPARPGWMSREEYAEYPKNITIRETKIVSQRLGFRAETQVIVTTFVDDKDVTSSNLSELYSLRWFVELDLRSVKTVMRMDVLRGKTPEMVRKEIWAHILAYNLVRKVMLQAAVLYQRNPREMSFKLALQMISAFRQAGILCEKNNGIYTGFLRAIVVKKTGKQKRPGQPRVVKRRPKAFPRMQKPRVAYQKKVKAA